MPLDGPAHGEAIRATADGPLRFARLSPGRYRIEGAFPATAAQGDLDIRPTPQKREEARTP